MASTKVLLGVVAGTGVVAIAFVAGVRWAQHQREPQTTTAAVPTHHEGASMKVPEPAQQGQVMINGRALTASQLQELEKLYRVRPRAGNYWYDARSGLYGTVGAPAAGFMYPGHDFGALGSTASAGNSEAYLNGRNLTTSEVQILAHLAQTPVAPGRYWLDAQGNAGYEGSDIPAGNLFAAARAAQLRAGGGGDNFWTSRFSAGNYNADNSQGYVSVPGIGPVGYGF